MLGSEALGPTAPDLVCYGCGEWFTFGVRDVAEDKRHPTHWCLWLFGRSDFHWEEDLTWPVCSECGQLLHVFLIVSEDPRELHSERRSGV